MMKDFPSKKLKLILEEQKEGRIALTYILHFLQITSGHYQHSVYMFCFPYLPFDIQTKMLLLTLILPLQGSILFYFIFFLFWIDLYTNDS